MRTETEEKPSKTGKKSNRLQASPSLRTHPPLEELYAMGKSLRDSCPRSSHAAWQPPPDRLDPIVLLEESSKGRVPHLIPIRYGRMLRSPFTFYRGAAMSMAADLAHTPTSGLRAQLCGDCHLCNFGLFATPERRVIFDINDLDETLPGPWEWDVKRLAASFELAGRSNGFSAADARDAALSCVRSYREHMAEFSQMRVLDVWYSSIDFETLMSMAPSDVTRKRMQKRLAKARERSVLEHDFPQLVTTTGMAPAIKDNPPTIYHLTEHGHEEYSANLQRLFASYRESLPEHRRVVLDRFKLMDVAVKVVGVGSVGTLCGIMLMMASDKDPLFLQVKQAGPSVLEPYVGKSRHENHGQRVVHGCYLMQSASDQFLGWTEGQAGRHFYIRQLKDMKIKILVELLTPSEMNRYAAACGWNLARAHARSGEAAKMSGYMGRSSDRFDKAIADFAKAYADQSERDHEVLTRAVREGRLEVFIEDEA